MINNNYSVNNPILNKGNQAAVKQGNKTAQNSSEKLHDTKSINNDFTSELVKQQTELADNSNHISQQQQNDSQSDSSDFTMILASHDSEQENLRYDQPSAAERGAIATYQQVATHSQREQVLESMSFHFVV